MKRLICVVLCLIIAVSVPFSASAAGGAFLLMDGRTATVLEEENGYSQLPMASTTKVMTALVVLKKAKLSDTVKIPGEAQGIEGSSLYIKAGENYTIEELLYGLMLQSANDCAVALAWYVGGSVEAFVGMMNEQAREMGLKNTRFFNPNGLPAEGHYTTAYELALIMKAAMELPAFRTITATKRYTVKDQTIVNHNKLLSLYPHCIGGKTGYTIAAGRCLVTIAQQKGSPLICVTLGRRDDWNIHTNAYEAWFPKIKTVDLIEKGAFSTELRVAGGGSVTAVNCDKISTSLYLYDGTVETTVLAGPFIYADKEVGDIVGTVECWYKGVKIGESPLVLTDKIQAVVKKELFITRIIRFFRRIFLKKE